MIINLKTDLSSFNLNFDNSKIFNYDALLQKIQNSLVDYSLVNNKINFKKLVELINLDVIEI